MIKIQAVVLSNIICEYEALLKNTTPSYGSVRVNVLRIQRGNQWLTPNEKLILELSYRVNHYAQDVYGQVRSLKPHEVVELELNSIYTSKKLPPFTDKKGVKNYFIKGWGNESSYLNSEGNEVPANLIRLVKLHKKERIGTPKFCVELIDYLKRNESKTTLIKSS